MARSVPLRFTVRSVENDTAHVVFSPDAAAAPDSTQRRATLSRAA
jgi:hypothetical protein